MNISPPELGARLFESRWNKRLLLVYVGKRETILMKAYLELLHRYVGNGQLPPHVYTEELVEQWRNHDYQSEMHGPPLSGDQKFVMLRSSDE